jgi:hypothetical protein
MGPISAVRSDAIGPFQPRRSRAGAAAFGGLSAALALWSPGQFLTLNVTSLPPITALREIYSSLLAGQEHGRTIPLAVLGRSFDHLVAA